jgi:hypothetical protein
LSSFSNIKAFIFLKPNDFAGILLAGSVNTNSSCEKAPNVKKTNNAESKIFIL